MFPHGCWRICNSLWAHIEHPEDVCVKWCRVKNPLPTIKLSFIVACFSPCSSICGRQFPTVTRFLFLLCSPFLIYSLFCKSTLLITSYPLHLFKMTLFLLSLFDIYLYHHKSIQIFQARLNAKTWLAPLLQNFCCTFQVIRTPKEL